MSETPAQYIYDVAFSFHSKDESIASQLNDRLHDRFETFLYSERQKELAGTDGETTFNQVFGEKARFVVIFYRKEWGETPFTRIEQTAIRNRAFTEGFDFTLFIPTESPASAPKWLPKPRLYFGLERFGLDGAAAVIESRIEELGGEPRTESAGDRAARFQRFRRLENEKTSFQQNEIGVAQANEAYELLITTMKAEVAKIKTDSPDVEIQVRSVYGIDLFAGLGPAMTLFWQCRYSNTLDGALLRAEIHSGIPKIPGLMPPFEPPRQLRTTEFTFELTAIDRTAYVEKSTRREFQPQALASYLLTTYLDYAEKHKRSR